MAWNGLTKEILKNKNIHLYYKQNDRKFKIIQNFKILKAATTVISIASICLHADKIRITESKEVVVKAIDTIKLPKRASQQIILKCKKRLKPFLSEDYRTISSIK